MGGRPGNNTAEISVNEPEHFTPEGMSCMIPARQLDCSMIRRLALLCILLFAVPAPRMFARGVHSYEDAFDAGRRVFPHESFRVAWIPVGSTQSLGQADGNPVHGGPTPYSMALGRVLAAAEKRQVTIVIAGPESAQSRETVVAATQLVHHMLPHLRILFLGDLPDSRIVRFVIEKIGGEVVDIDAS